MARSQSPGGPSESDESVVRKRLEALEESLSPHACRSARSLGRDRAEEPSPLRTEFQRDRDRIIHTNAFRRLKHKTQVFIAPAGDHYATRLTHTLEVAQIGRTIGRALNLNEDLVEAMSYGHDLGHTPFGHLGEETLDQLYGPGFAHSHQSLRIVEHLEKDGMGLNLTKEVRQGIVSHSKPRGDFLESGADEHLILEAQVLRLADIVAYLNHDIADAVRAGQLSVSDLPERVNRALGTSHAERINTLVSDIVTASWAATGLEKGPDERPVITPMITMSREAREAMMELREFMFDRIYLPQGATDRAEVAREVMALLYNHYAGNPEEVPPPYFGAGVDPQRAAVDYVSGMTDLYAIRLAERLRPGLTQNTFPGLSLRLGEEGDSEPD